MADSDNTTTLPVVTRRKMLAGTAIGIGAWSSNTFADNKMTGEPSTDPVLALWHQWHDAHHLTDSLCRQQQDLERQLFETIGVPCATIQLSYGKRIVTYSPEAIDDVLTREPEETAACAKAKADLAAHQLQWDEADREIGYSAAVQTEWQAGNRAAELLAAMAATSATSVMGVAAKLDAVLREGDIWKNRAEFPWPQIRSALDDILHIGHHGANEGAP